MIKSFLYTLIFFISFNTVAQEQYKPEWKSLEKHKAVPQWFADSKLGIYFHWGVYSVPAHGGEWYGRWMYTPDRVGWGSTIYKQHRKDYGKDFQYHDFIPLWKAPKFDAKQWVDMFENMGAKFIGSIAEHHDGFSLWDSKVNEWNSVDMGPKLNVVKAIAEETKKRNIKFMATFHHGFHNLFFPKKEASVLRPNSRHLLSYESIETPQDLKFKKLYGDLSYEDENQIWLDKLNEVVDTYAPDYVWMDFGQRYIKESYRKAFLTNYFNKAQQNNQEVVVNTKGDFFPTSLSVVNVERATMEDITPEVWITDFILGSAWCYDKTKRTAIDPKQAIKMLAEVVSKNGIMLLSAGPKADGTIPEEQVVAMENIGAWMQLYGESIYNTKPFIEFGQGSTQLKRDPNDAWNAYGAIKKGLNKLNAKDIRYTQKGKTVYAIQLGWDNNNGERLLEVFRKENKLKVNTITALGTREKIKWKQTKKGLIVHQPKEKPKEADAALVYKIILN